MHPNLYSSNNSAGKLDADEWNHLVFTGTGGKLNLYMNGVLNTSPNFQEGAQVGGFVIAQANNNSAGAIHDEVGLHKLARHERWVNATYQSQVPGNSFVNYGTLAGPPYFEIRSPNCTERKTRHRTLHPNGLRRRFPNLHRGRSPSGVVDQLLNGSNHRSHGRSGSEQLYGDGKRRQRRGRGQIGEQNLFHQDFRSRCVSLQDELHLSGHAGSSTLNQFPYCSPLTRASADSGNSFASATAGDLLWHPPGRNFPMRSKPGISPEPLEFGCAPDRFQEPTSHHRGTGRCSGNRTFFVFDGSAWSNGYQAAWHFQEMSGLLTTDSTSNNRHLTAEGEHHRYRTGR